MKMKYKYLLKKNFVVVLNYIYNYYLIKGVMLLLLLNLCGNSIDKGERN